jgi:hypothetical protein
MRSLLLLRHNFKYSSNVTDFSEESQKRTREFHGSGKLNLCETIVFRHFTFDS